jgi:integrase
MKNSTEQKPTSSNKKSGKQVASGRSKTDLRYWQKAIFRPASGSGGLVPDYFCRIAHQGHRTTFPLSLPNQESAAEKARTIYTFLIANGWEATLAKFKPSAYKDAREASKGTVGEFLATVQALADITPSTLSGYSRSFRHIVADIQGIARDPSRFDASFGGAKKWREKVDSVKLASIKPELIQAWRLEYVKKAGNEPDAIATAKVSANSVMRQAKSLFSKKILKFVEERFPLPSPLPFEGVEFFGKLRSHYRYQSKIDARELLAQAVEELAPEKPETFKILILALCCGLRKNEIDKLMWSEVNFEAGLIQIRTTRYFKAKSDESAADVDVDTEIIALLRAWKASTEGQFVIPSSIAPKTGTTYAHYRVERHFNALRSWLREKGITSQKYLHELRKEYGSLVAHQHGLYAASRALRHSDVQVTAMHYLDKKERISIGLGAVLAGNLPKNVIQATKSDFIGNCDTTPAIEPKRKRTSK